jgi:hypothetical protein
MDDKVSTSEYGLPVPKTEAEIRRLRDLVLSGRYQVPAEKVAEAILELIIPTGRGPARRAGDGPSPLLPFEPS